MLNDCSEVVIGCDMIRLTVVLCAGLFAVLLIQGEDKGQVRQGLRTPPVVAEAPVPVVQPAPAPVVEPQATITEAVFVPAQPVRVQPESPIPVVAVAKPAPDIANRLAVVTARSANVRFGPSTADAVIGRLVAGEQVLVVLEDTATEGWSRVRIEGDGIEGYVAARLLQAVAP